MKDQKHLCRVIFGFDGNQSINMNKMINMEDLFTIEGVNLSLSSNNLNPIELSIKGFQNASEFEAECCRLNLVRYNRNSSKAFKNMIEDPGISSEELAKRLGISLQTLKQRLKRIGITLKANNRFQALNMMFSRSTTFPRDNRLTNRENLILNLHTRGLNIDQISKLVHCSKRSVYRTNATIKQALNVPDLEHAVLDVLSKNDCMVTLEDIKEEDRDFDNDSIVVERLIKDNSNDK